MLFWSKKILIFFLLIAVNYSLFGQKTDKVYLLNGNNITCEIIELELGKLDCKTSDIGRIKVEWDAVDSLWSNKEFEIHLRDGTIVYSTLDSSFYEYGNYEFSEIIELFQIKNKFWSSLDGNLDIGFSYTKSSGILQLNVDSRVLYRFHRSELDLNIQSITTLDKNEAKTDKKSASLNLKRYSKNNFFYKGSGSYDQNSELGLKGRYSIAGGFGKSLVYRPSTRLDAAFGALLNEELSTEANSSSTTNFELVGVIEFRKFSYNFPELDLYADVSLYASMNDLGRLRGDFNTNAKFEIISNFYIKFTIYYSFDTRPADETASQNDWGTTLTLSYTF